MIRYLDEILGALLKDKAPKGSELAAERTQITFDLPDAEWRGNVQIPTVNLYLYDIRENKNLSTVEPLVQRNQKDVVVARFPPPARIDCAYCITAWYPKNSKSAVLDEHRLLSQVLLVLLQNLTISVDYLNNLKALNHNKLEFPSYFFNLTPPYPTAIASADGMKNQSEFWGALGQPLKPSLNYVVTLAVMAEKLPILPGPVKDLKIVVDDPASKPSKPKSGDS